MYDGLWLMGLIRECVLKCDWYSYDACDWEGEAGGRAIRDCESLEKRLIFWQLTFFDCWVKGTLFTSTVPLWVKMRIIFFWWLQLFCRLYHSCTVNKLVKGSGAVCTNESLPIVFLHIYNKKRTQRALTVLIIISKIIWFKPGSNNHNPLKQKINI